MAMQSNDSAISQLNDLIETCRDGQEGFRLAAEGAKDSELKVLFQQFSQQRANFSNELAAEVRRLGGNPENSGSLSGAVHRGWINIKSAVTGGDDDAIISECERGEDVAKAAYQKVDYAALPGPAAEVVRRQAAEVRATHDRVRALEKAHQS